MARHAFVRFALGICALFVLAACGTTTTTTRSLPAYEPPIAISNFQTVRTTAYTHTESDHRQHGARNALGGRLQAASRPIHRVEIAPRALPIDDSGESDYRTISYSGTRRQTSEKRGKKRRSTARYSRSKPPRIGSAAADWSRWPAGTTFRLLSTGQIYKVEDYGWALSGRNTIDLYMATRGAMDNWGVRSEPIQILRWGDAQESLRFLQPKQGHRHIRRMVLELQGAHQEAAAMQ